MSPLEAAKLPPDALWTVDDVMAYLRASRSWIYQKVAEGRLPCLRVGGLLRFKADAVRAWAEGTAQAAPVLTLKGRP
jgi:excisionase family DNA binding protein